MRWSARRTLALLVVVILLALMVLLVSLWIGSSGFSWPSDPEILKARGQRVSLAFLVGAALGCAGTIFQAVLRNPLADPYLLGISSGASLGVFCWKVPAISGAILTTAPWLSSGPYYFAIAGAWLTTALVLTIVSIRRRTDPSTIVLVGVMVSTIVGAILLLMYQFVRSLPGSGYFQSLFVGELQSNVALNEIATQAFVLTGFIVLAMYWRRPLDLLMLSDDEARSLGVKVGWYRIALLILASLITAQAVALSGPIGFVGLIAPHAGRLLVGSTHARLIWVATLLGAILLTSADALTRGLAHFDTVNTVLPIGVVTSLIGGPLFIALLLRDVKRREA